MQSKIKVTKKLFFSKCSKITVLGNDTDRSKLYAKKN